MSSFLRGRGPKDLESALDQRWVIIAKGPKRKIEIIALPFFMTNTLQMFAEKRSSLGSLPMSFDL
jgi:hypothetical protein